MATARRSLLTDSRRGPPRRLTFAPSAYSRNRRGFRPDRLHRVAGRGPASSDRDGVRAGRAPLRREQGGAVRVIKNGACLPTPFVTLTVDSGAASAACSASPSTPTSRQPLRLRLLHGHDARPSTTASAASRPSGDVAVAGQRDGLARARRPLSRATNHNGGALHFGPDGKLYVAVGENANGANAQTLANLLGQDAADQPRRHDPLRQPVLRRGDAARTARSGRWACATRSRSRSSPAPAGCSSTTSARAPGKRSTTASRAPTTAGRRTEGADQRSALPRPALLLRPRSTQDPNGLRDHRRGVLQPAGSAVPGRLRRRLLLRRLLQRLHPHVRPGDRSLCAVRDECEFPGRPTGWPGRRVVLPRRRLWFARANYLRGEVFDDRPRAQHRPARRNRQFQLDGDRRRTGIRHLRRLNAGWLRLLRLVGSRALAHRRWPASHRLSGLRTALDKHTRRLAV